MTRLRANEKPTYLVGSTGCMISATQLNNGGYGPHRSRWIRENGPVPEGMDLDHLCRNRWCINTAHLELVTRKENLARGKQSSRKDPTLCRKGLHPWVEENIFIDSRGKSVCAACREAWLINWRDTTYRAKAQKEL